MASWHVDMASKLTGGLCVIDELHGRLQRKRRRELKPLVKRKRAFCTSCSRELERRFIWGFGNETAKISAELSARCYPTALCWLFRLPPGLDVQFVHLVQRQVQELVLVLPSCVFLLPLLCRLARWWRRGRDLRDQIRRRRLRDPVDEHTK